MRPDLRIVTKLPLAELWDDHGTVTGGRVRALRQNNLVELLRSGPVQFVVADCGSNLEWIPMDERFAFWKKIQRQIADLDPHQPIRLEQFRTGRHIPPLNGVGVVANVWFRYDSTVTIWDIDSGQVVRTLQGPGRIEGVCFSANGRIVGAGNREGMLPLWNAATGEEVLNMTRPAIVFSVRFSPDDRLLATTNGSQIDLWAVNWNAGSTKNK
jgi:WD40 repeat protein